MQKSHTSNVCQILMHLLILEPRNIISWIHLPHMKYPIEITHCSTVTIAKEWKMFMCLAMGDWLNKLRYIRVYLNNRILCSCKKKPFYVLIGKIPRYTVKLKKTYIFLIRYKKMDWQLLEEAGGGEEQGMVRVGWVKWVGGQKVPSFQLQI